MIIKQELELFAIFSTQNSNKDYITSVINKLCASTITPPISYIFFLCANGRYVADAFFIQMKETNYLLTKKNIAQNLKTHIKKYDIKNEIQFSTQPSFIYHSSENEPDFINIFPDVRILNSTIIISDTEIINAQPEEKWQEIRLANEIAEFEDFEYQRSIILEYGKISKFIDHNKGCYLGQEFMQRTHSLGVIRKNIEITNINDSRIIKILIQKNNQALALIRKEIV